MTSPFFYVCSVFLILFSYAAGAAPPAAANADEIQVLIDISGSMKQNDPENQRVDATKLLINLLPEKSNATIWLFAEKTTLLLHSDSVDENWKKQAGKATTEIRSNGLFTDIEKAIQTALNYGFKNKGKKHLILLTDGLVDISKDIMVSADSRERVLSELIPELQQQAIKVNTIALSEQADKELLYELAIATGGWTESAESADELQRLFLKMMLKAAPKDNLPLVGNRFTVDGNVKEFSVLAFRKKSSSPSKLITPQQKNIDKTSAPANFSWLETPSYDLITVKQPISGEWQLVADIDPDNQVMILTDLKMQMADLENFNSKNEALSLKVFFTEQNKLINRPDFLNLISITANLDRQAPFDLPMQSGQTGYFAKQLNALPAGRHQLTIQADGKTFKREISREFIVTADPIKVEMHIDDANRSVTLNFFPDGTLIDKTSLLISATINRPGQAPENRMIDAKDELWQLRVEEIPAGETVINFTVNAKNPDGNTANPVLKPIKITDSMFSASPPKPEPPAEEKHARLAKEAEPETATADDAEESEPKAKKHDDEAESEATEEETPTNWMEVGGIVMLVNVFMLIAGYFIHRAIRQARLNKQEQLLARLS